ncbi:MAG TPA: aldehyde dehydrogenase family protein [Caulobacteraceae bacterium]
MSFQLTYATMFNPPEAMHERFEAALEKVRAGLGARHLLFIDGADRDGASVVRRVSPIDTSLHVGDFVQASAGDVAEAMAAARRAFPAWRALRPAERAAHMRKVADLLESRVYEIAAAMVLEVGKTRMEALGETQESVDFFRLYADDFESHQGYDRPLPNDPLEGAVSTNQSILRPYGVWAVVAPFNFPLALAGGPVAAALVTGNTVVVKGASDTPWAGRLLADCIRDAGLPSGVFNYLVGPGGEVGEAMIADPHLAGLTFTGSVDVGMALVRRMAGGAYPRPCIAEMGGKNACIVTPGADLERAAAGIVRSAYGMGGQKCSALSRLYVHESLADPLLERIAGAVEALTIGDPTLRRTWLGPVINARAHESFCAYAGQLAEGGARLIAGGSPAAGLPDGYYVAPILAESPLSHPLWKQEMFLPILMAHRFTDRDEAMALANDSDVGLTAGFFGAAKDVAWFQDNIEAGVTYANRAQGATTGAWPGYQPFGGWKGSGSTGKGIASFYYLAQYQREQSRTVVEASQ